MSRLLFNSESISEFVSTPPQHLLRQQDFSTPADQRNTICMNECLSHDRLLTAFHPQPTKHSLKSRISLWFLSVQGDCHMLPAVLWHAGLSFCQHVSTLSCCHKDCSFWFSVTYSSYQPRRIKLDTDYWPAAQRPLESNSFTPHHGEPSIRIRVRCQPLYSLVPSLCIEGYAFSLSLWPEQSKRLHHAYCHYLRQGYFVFVSNTTEYARVI